MSNAKDNRIAQLQEQNTELHKICTRQRDSLAAQQETIVRLNMQMDSILACLAEKYGFPSAQEGGPTKHQLSFPVDRFPDALVRCQVSAVKEDGLFIITVTPRAQESEEAGNGEV